MCFCCLILKISAVEISVFSPTQWNQMEQKQPAEKFNSSVQKP